MKNKLWLFGACSTFCKGKFCTSWREVFYWQATDVGDKIEENPALYSSPLMLLEGSG